MKQEQYIQARCKVEQQWCNTAESWCSGDQPSRGILYSLKFHDM